MKLSITFSRKSKYEDASLVKGTYPLGQQWNSFVVLW